MRNCGSRGRVGCGGVDRSLASTRLSLRTRVLTGGVGSGREPCAAPSGLPAARDDGLLLISEQVGHV